MVPGTILTDTLFDELNALFSFGNPIIGIIMQAVANHAVDRALDYLKRGINELAASLAPKTPDLTVTNADFLVNLYGTKDILNELGIGGYRATLGGFTLTGQRDPVSNETTKQLFNIQITGADHFDYMRDSARPNQTWNLTLSDFVARLMVASKSREGLIQFLNSRDSGIVLPPNSPENPNNYYIINLPGHP